MHHGGSDLADGLHLQASRGNKTRSHRVATEMSPNARAAARHRPSRLHLALAALWMFVSLAMGGVVGTQSSADTAGTPPSISRTIQP